MAAFEVKFIVSASAAPAIRDWARRHLEPDPHGTGRAGDEYVTTSLYFDTDDCHVLAKHGSYGRAKYRVRRYGLMDTLFLERKLRTSRLLAKRRTALPLSDLKRLAYPSLHAGWRGRWFASRIAVRQLKPVLQVTYQRMARVATAPFGQARLTLDHRLAAVPVDGFAFVDSPGQRVLDGLMILELKYRGRLPSVFKTCIEEFGLSPDAVSKYRLGAEALDVARMPIAGRRRTA